jgi:hypothetical protein
MAQKIDLDIDKFPWEAVARVMAPILAPIILATAWIVLAKTNKTVDWLSNLFALAELTPTVDLNLPSGIVLGSFYNSAEEIKPVVDKGIGLVGDVVKQIPTKKDVEDGAEQVLTGLTKFALWLVSGGR